MGKLAARMVVDTAGHSGIIISGSPNVLIGGMPAARKGDGISCHSHGTGAIIEGESTVLINGKPVARIGDKTSCEAMPEYSEVGKPPQHAHLTLAKNTDEKGFIENGKDIPDWADVQIKPFYVGYDRTDANKNGEYDKIKDQMTMLDFKSKFGNEYAGVKFDSRLFDVKGEARSGWDNGYYGATSKADAEVIGFKAGEHIGNDDARLAYSEANLDVLCAKHEATAELYTGDKEGKIGIKLRTTEKAALAKIGAKVGTDVLNGKYEHGENKGKIPTGVGAQAEIGVGWDLGVEAYYDKDNYSGSVKLDIGGILGIGGKLSLSLSVNFKPFIDLRNWILGDDKEGVVISGCSDVWIGT